MGANPHLIANSAEVIAEQERCYELRLDGLSIREIARRIGKSHQTVQNRLNDEWARRIGPMSDRLRDEDLNKLDERESRLMKELAAINVGDNPDAVVRLTNSFLLIVDKRCRITYGYAPQRVSVTGEMDVSVPDAVRDAIRRAKEAADRRVEEIRSAGNGA